MPGSITRFALVFLAADNRHRIKYTLVEGSFQQVCIDSLLELDYMFFHAQRLKVKQSLTCVLKTLCAKSNYSCEIWVPVLFCRKTLAKTQKNPQKKFGFVYIHSVTIDNRVVL